MGEECNFDLENAKIFINEQELGKLKDIKIDIENTDDITIINYWKPFKNCYGTIKMNRKSKRYINKLFKNLMQNNNYKKYLKRVKNRQKLYEKLKKIGRKIK